jgi:hypothetical protein
MDSFKRNFPTLAARGLLARGRMEQEINEGIAERNRILVAMDQAAFRASMLKMGAGVISEEATLPAMHKARWHCPDIDAALRLESGRWLLEHKFGDLYGGDIDLNRLPTGQEL